MSDLKESFKTVVRRQVDALPIQPKVDRRLERLEKCVRELTAALEQQQVAHAQLWSAVRQAEGILPLPPAHLQARVAGSYYAEFVEHGERLLDCLQSALAAAGAELTALPSVLDFGCGCGRVLRALHYRRGPGQKLFGTDIDAEAIDWCARNYPSIAEFRVNPTEPPMPFAEESFDLAIGLSVFTHLPEAMQDPWLRDLGRVIRPGGYLLLTIHGTKHFQRVPEADRAAALQAGIYYERVGATEGLPDFYQATYHTPGYIRRHWSHYFDIIDVRERAIDDHQDIVVCRARQGA